ncbi:MAG: prephenate dehydratase [Candidatus Omnitrophica bacterium]|nr:prephenate dehydratase [Candidatus Omnitrophota bacterium]
MGKRATTTTLKQLRKRIDQLDTRLIGLLNERAKLAKAVGLLKTQKGVSIFSPEREEQVYAHARGKNGGPLSDEALQAIFREVLSASRALLRNLRVAYQGPAMSFAHQAARRVFGSRAVYQPCETIGDVFTEVEQRRVDHGVVPIENSLEGTVGYTLDRLVDTDLIVVSEIFQPIDHHLAGMVPISKIKRLYIHPQAHAQCRRWLESHLGGVRIVETLSTSMAASMAHSHSKEAAAVTSEEAARKNGLKILASSIGDSARNLTRFFVLGNTPASVTGNDKTSLVFSIKDRVAALHDMLAPFRKYRINLTKIESRPSRKKAWDYYFFVDLEGHQQEPKIAKALSELQHKATWMKVLGSYPRPVRR